MPNDERISNLIQTFIRAKKSGELEDESNPHEIVEGYRKWQRENILDLTKLKNYSDQEFAEKFGEMYYHTDGSASSNALNLGMHFKTDESRIAVRPQFEKMIEYINDVNNDRFELVEKILDSVELKVPGMGIHMVTALVNAKYPDVPTVNETTKDFFKNIGEPLPAKLSDAQREVAEFFKEIVELSNNELNLDDANLIFWYTKAIETGRKFMERNYGTTFEAKQTRRAGRTVRVKAKTREEMFAETLSHLQAIHDQAMSEK